MYFAFIWSDRCQFIAYWGGKECQQLIALDTGFTPKCDEQLTNQGNHFIS